MAYIFRSGPKRRNLTDKKRFKVNLGTMKATLGIVFAICIGSVLMVIIGPREFAIAAEKSKWFSSGSVVETRGEKEYGENTLDIQGLRNCFTLEGELVEQERLLESNEEALEAKSSAVETFFTDMSNAAKLLEEKRKKGFNTQLEVDSFNREVEAFNSKIADYNKLTKERAEMENNYNSAVKAYNAGLDKFRNLCAKKRYFADDYEKAQLKYQQKSRTRD